ncbi:MAG: hypothetical protein L6Q72_20280 [Burkholderiaceae bacterium]|nr:hypothetical protein [Burkholderiaceae bacterium]
MAWTVPLTEDRGALGGRDQPGPPDDDGVPGGVARKADRVGTAAAGGLQQAAVDGDEVALAVAGEIQADRSRRHGGAPVDRDDVVADQVGAERPQIDAVGVSLDAPAGVHREGVAADVAARVDHAHRAEEVAVGDDAAVAVDRQHVADSAERDAIEVGRAPDRAVDRDRVVVVERQRRVAAGVEAGAAADREDDAVVGAVALLRRLGGVADDRDVALTRQVAAARDDVAGRRRGIGLQRHGDADGRGTQQRGAAEEAAPERR